MHIIINIPELNTKIYQTKMVCICECIFSLLQLWRHPAQHTYFTLFHKKRTKVQIHLLGQNCLNHRFSVHNSYKTLKKIHGSKNFAEENECFIFYPDKFT